MNRASLIIAGAAAVLSGACSSHPGPTPAPSADTFWLAPNGSEVVLKLVQSPQTVPF